MTIILRLPIILLVSSLVACSTAPTIESPTEQDGPPSQTIDPSSIKDPKPKVEPYSKYGNPPSYTVRGKKYEVWDSHHGYEQIGTASWYGTKFHGKRTSSSEPYDMYGMSAAHKNLPIPSYARVTNLDNGKSVIVRVNDRGPFADDRIIDLSYAAATKLGMLGKGTAKVKVEAIDSHGFQKNPPPTYAKAEKVGNKIYLQVATFNQRGNAETLVKQIKQKGKASVEISAEDSRFRVLIGPFDQEKDAKAFHANLAELKLGRPLVVKR